jgi:transposase InsO family protein
LPIVGITKHQYYYQPKGKRPGRKPSEATLRKHGQTITEESNQQVVERIVDIKSDPETDYGYRKMYFALMLLGYYINHKKVYRLMKENNLLKERYKRSGKTYAKYRIVTPEGPLEVFEMDIKYVWVTQARRHAFILSIIDTFTRAVLHWQLGFTMKSAQVKQAWEYIIVNYLQPADLLSKGVHIEIRNDNGPQFASKLIREFFTQNYLTQVFTHPYTPQENGHIESFHSILSSTLGNQPFWDIDELENRLKVFYPKYNNVRLHGSIANLAPAMFWKLWDEKKITRKVLDNKKVKFTLNIPYQQLSGNGSLREVPCLNNHPLDAVDYLQKEAHGPETLQQPSVQRSPSVVPC